MSTNPSIWRDTPALQPSDALPLGNGHLGAMDYGGIQEERIELSEDTLWSGVPRTYTNPKAPALITRIRQALLPRQDCQKAERLCRKLQGLNAERPQAMGTLRLAFTETVQVKNYRHELSLIDAQTTTTCQLNGHALKREVFCSYPDQVLVLRMTMGKSVLPTLRIALDSHLPSQVQATEQRILLTGRAPSHTDSQLNCQWDEQDAVSFALMAQLALSGGTVSADATGSLTISGASSITLLVSAATSYNGYAKHPVLNGKSPVKLADHTLSLARRRSLDDLLSRHRADFMPLFAACGLTLGSTSQSILPTPRRLAAFQDTPDPALAALLFNYGRYLLLVSSRAASQPSGRHGRWQPARPSGEDAEWSVNGPLEMSYWPVGPANLPDCQEPVLKLLEELRKTGSLVASVNYNCRGWCVHHATDLWRLPCPAGDFGKLPPRLVNWPMGGIWLSLTLWESCAFAADVDCLRRKVWPIMKGAALFALDWLVAQESAGEDVLLTVPSVSPLDTFRTPQGTEGDVHLGSTCDMSLLKELFSNCLITGQILKLERDPVIREIRKVLPRLLPFSLGSDGQLQAWPDDTSPGTPSSRHLAHCLSCYPGRLITQEETPELAAGVQRHLDQLESAGSSESPTWELCLRARLHQGNQAWQVLRSLCQSPQNSGLGQEGTGLGGNLLTLRPDAGIHHNLGITAGMAEMLIQSHRMDGMNAKHLPLYLITLLPALPDDWHRGTATGLRARGGLRFDLSWEDNRLTRAVVTSTSDTVCLLDTSCELNVTLGRRHVETRDHHGHLAFDITAGGEYTLTPKSAHP